MRIGLRVLLGYFLIVAIAALLLSQVFVRQIKPGVRQAMEDTLIDTANLLAELAADDLKSGHIADGRFAAGVRATQAREVGAELYGFDKLRTAYRITVTDARGIVVYDSEGRDLGRDNSRWNDVYRTLHGQYGARSTQEIPGDEESSVMHVAAPILDRGRIIGVLTVAKPNRIVAPFIQASQRKVWQGGLLLLAVAVLMGLAMAWWLSRRLGQLRRYADAVTAGDRATPPPLSGEFGALGQALAKMREELEGKQYVEHYVHALTHELKSPLTALRGSAELLRDAGGGMGEAERAAFVETIHAQGERMAQTVDKLLALAAVEHRQALDAPVPLDAGAILRDAMAAAAPRAERAGIALRLREPDAVPLRLQGDAFLLRQALGNLIDNAIDFSPRGATVDIAAGQESGMLQLQVSDRGTGIPDYARGRIFERFYSLPRPGSGERSSGLGLPFVAEVAALHGGRVAIAPREGGGVRATLELPASS